MDLTPKNKSSRRGRAIAFDLLALFASVPAAYVRALGRPGPLDLGAFVDGLKWGLPFSFLLILSRRFMHARKRGKTEEYDYCTMNPKGRFKASELLSPVPYINWEKHAGEEAFFEGLIDRDRFVDTPGLALDVRCPDTVEGILTKLQPFRAAALHWDGAAEGEGGGYNVHAVFDIPPAANQWTSDHGARMWVRISPIGEGACRVRAVFGVGGFGQGQPTGPLHGLNLAISPTVLTTLAAGAALKTEAKLRGAVSWWLMVGTVLGVGEREFTDLSNANLTAKIIAGEMKSLANKQTGKIVLWTVVGTIGLLIVAPLVIYMIAEVLS